MLFYFIFFYSVSKHIFLDFDRMKLSAHPLSFSYNQHNLCSCWYISKSLDVPQIILLDYLPVSTTCRSVLSIGQSAARRVFESVNVSHGRHTHWWAWGDTAATTAISCHQLGFQSPDLCSAEGEWVMFICTFGHLAQVVQHQKIALQDQLTLTVNGHEQLQQMCLQGPLLWFSSSLSRRKKKKKKGQDNNREIIIHRFFTVMIGCFALPARALVW